MQEGTCMLWTSQLCVSNREERRWNCPVTTQNTVRYRYIKARMVGQSRYFVLVLKWICSYQTSGSLHGEFLATFRSMLKPNWTVLQERSLWVLYRDRTLSLSWPWGRARTRTQTHTLDRDYGVVCRLESQLHTLYVLLFQPARIETVSDALLSFVIFLVMQRNEPKQFLACWT
jgi:hypothetical protein